MTDDSSADDPVHDRQRLQRLERLGLLDTPAEEAFDRLTRLACRVLDAPVALLSLVDGERQFFKSAAGLAEPWASQRQTPLSHSFCRHVVNSGQALVISDASSDRRLHDNPAITDLGVIAYAGIPVTTSEGYVLGSFCVIDHQPHQWSQYDLDILQDLTAAAMTEIELRFQLYEQKLLQEQFRALIEQAADAIFIASPDGVYSQINDSACQLLGYRRDELIGMPVSGIVADDERERLQALREQLMRSGEASISEWTLRHQNGTAVIVEISAKILASGQWQAIARDITGRKQTERALMTSEARLRLALDAADLITFDQDLQTNRVEVSHGFRELYGFAPDEKVNFDSIVEHIHPDDRQRWLQANRHATASDGALRHEYRVNPAGHDHAWVQTMSRLVYSDDGDNRKPVRRVGVIQEITNRKRIEAALRESEEQLRLALDVAGLALWEWDIQNDRIIWADKLYDRLALKPRAIFGSFNDFLHDYVHPDDRSRLQQTIDRSLTERTRYECEFRMLRADGEIRWTLGMGQSLSDEEGTPVRLLGVDFDVTERKQVEQVLARAKAAADRANLTKSQFLANMSHEIRTPMSAILGYADVLSMHLTDPDDLSCINIIRRNGQYLLALINDILDLSKIEANRLEITRERFSPQTLVMEVCALMSVKAGEKGLTLMLAFDGPVPATIDSDPRRLQQILINLLGNAIKFTHRGQVTLRVSLRDEIDNSRLRFEVSDTGIGISKSQQEKLFKPFTQLDNDNTSEHRGTGLGLIISLRLAELLDGTIEVDSQWRHGSTFILTIATGPLEGVERITVETGDWHAPAAGAIPADLQLQGRILVVDDRHDIRYLAQRYLEDAGALVTTAADGKAAVQAVTEARSRGEPFGIVVLDMQMPVMDGFTAARNLREQGFQGAILALTAYAMRGDREKCLAAGCDDYLAKPVERDALVAAVARLLQPLPQPLRSASGITALTEPVPAEPAICQKTPPASGQRVLVVDDSQDAADALSKILQLLHYEVHTAYNGHMALDLARDHRPAVVVLDINLPDLSGYEVAERLRSDNVLQQTVLIALSGQDDADDMPGKNHFDHFVMKPAAAGDLVRLFPQPE